jgi:hypothetical protein
VLQLWASFLQELHYIIFGQAEKGKAEVVGKMKEITR